MEGAELLDHFRLLNSFQEVERNCDEIAAVSICTTSKATETRCAWAGGPARPGPAVGSAGSKLASSSHASGCVEHQGKGTPRLQHAGFSQLCLAKGCRTLVFLDMGGKHALSGDCELCVLNNAVNGCGCNALSNAVQ